MKCKYDMSLKGQSARQGVENQAPGKLIKNKCPKSLGVTGKQLKKVGKKG